MQNLRCGDEYYTDRCIIEKPCSAVPDLGADLKLTMVDDEGHETMWTIKQKNLLIDGSVFGDSENSCHLAVMKSHDREDLTKWYVGNIMF